MLVHLLPLSSLQCTLAINSYQGHVFVWEQATNSSLGTPVLYHLVLQVSLFLLPISIICLCVCYFYIPVEVKNCLTFKLTLSKKGQLTMSIVIIYDQICGLDGSDTMPVSYSLGMPL